jgi:zinc protease
MRPRRLLALVLAVFAPALGAQAPDLASPLPADSSVVHGRLPNGLRYLIRRNVKPEKRAELRLVVNAGSILEDDAQRGLAHFVEHMAFNGTKRFPKSSIVDYLERVGMRFGADLNAYTSFDETVYMLQVPTDTAALVSSALDILEDWAHDVSFDGAELQKERGVVVEEWRTGRGAQERVQNRQFPVLLRGSPYVLRIPIGTKENLETFPDSLAVKFYRDWYRPELMTVVAVGDFDAKEMEAQIRSRFVKLVNPPSPRPRTLAAVPDHDETLVSIETDKEYPYSLVALLWKKAHDSTRTRGDFRRQLVASFYDGMMNARLSELAQKPDAPFAAAFTGRGSIVRTKDLYQLAGLVKEGGFEKAADALLAEAARVSRFGFTQTELDRQRIEMLRALEQQYAERDKTNSSQFAGEYVGNALSGDPILGIGDEQSLSRAFAPTITLSEVNALAKSSFTTRNRVVLVTAPEKASLKLPDERAMLGVFDRSNGATLTAYVDSTSDAPLVAAVPAGGRIVKERTLPESGIIEWTLSNGARLLLKPTDFKADEVLFYGRKPGGTSVVTDADQLDADLAGTIAMVSGVGDFSAVTLNKKLAGKVADAMASPGRYAETVNGSASSRDLETMFQLAWLRFTAPRADTSAFAAFKNQMRAILTNQQNSPERVFGDTVQVTMSQHHPRVRLMSPATFDSADVTRAMRLYRERMANGGGFTFFLVGSFSPDSVRPLVERYIGSLPATGGRESARDEGIRPPAGVVRKTVYKGIEPKAATRLVFTGPCAYSYQARHAIASLRELLNIRLREVLREEKGGTYGAGVQGSCSSTPYSHYEVAVFFGSAPERTDELTAAVLGVIEEIKAGTVSDSNVVKIREVQLRAHETALKQNGAWLRNMADADEDGRDQRDWLRYPELARQLSGLQLRDAARAFLRTEQYARFTLLPEAGVKPDVKP